MTTNPSPLSSISSALNGAVSGMSAPPATAASTASTASTPASTASTPAPTVPPSTVKPVAPAGTMATSKPVATAMAQKGGKRHKKSSRCALCMRKRYNRKGGSVTSMSSAYGDNMDMNSPNTSSSSDVGGHDMVNTVSSTLSNEYLANDNSMNTVGGKRRRRATKRRKSRKNKRHHSKKRRSSRIR